MKKAFFILVLSLSLVCFCSAACAEPEHCPYDPHLSIMYNYLTDNQRELYDSLYDAVFEGRSSVNAPAGMSREEILGVYSIIKKEAPELCAFGSIGDPGGMEIRLIYDHSIEEQDSFIEEVDALASRFRGLEEEQGILAIREYIINRFEYGLVDSPEAWGSNPRSAYYALMYNTAVCDGYAQTMTMLCHFAGYSCSFISGMMADDQGKFWSNNVHAWNVACVGTRFVWMDLTWDDGGSYPDDEWYDVDVQTMAETHLASREYDPIINLQGFLPADAVIGMFLDINDENGIVRGVLDKTGQRVRMKDLAQGQYYAPAMVIYNFGSTPLPVHVSYRLDGKMYDYWNDVTIKGESNIAFRTYKRAFGLPAGNHEITWYCDGNILGTFNWTAD